MSWGIRPEAAIGHSIGEYVAACLAGVFSLEDALALVAIRGRLMQQQPAGEMLSVCLSEAEIQPWLNREISLAANNAPSLCVVSGTTEAIAHLQQYLSEKGIACRRLHTSHAFHSAMMEPVLEPFTEAVQRIQLNPPQFSFISNVTGTWITTAEATDPHYWARHLRSYVRLAAGMAELIKEPKRILLEIGPGSTLSTFAKQQLNLTQQVVLSSLRHPKQELSDNAFLLNTLGRLWLAGVKIDWTQFYAHERRHRLPLPTYPFERQRYWIEGNQEAEVRSQELDREKKLSLADWFYVPSWERDLLPEPFHLEKLAQQKSCWLVFIDSYGIGDRLAQQLSLAGQDVITVAMGESLSELDYRALAIHPQKLEDYHALLEDLSLRELKPDFVVHLWGITLAQKSEIAAFEECQGQGFYSLLFLTQALEKQKITTPVRMMVVTNNLHDVVGEETVNPEKATVLGLCQVIPQEYPHINCRSIDVILPELEEQKKVLSDRLLAEFTARTTDLVIAYRGSHRWHQTFKPIRLDEAVEEKVRLREEGTYLIVGDLVKGLGLVFAKYLAQIQAKLILISHGELGKIQSLEAFGVEYLVIEADITDEAQMKAACDRAQERFGEIHGVFYSTPMTNPQSAAPIQLLGSAPCEYNFQTKVYGLYVLESVLRGRKLDFCLLQSSLSSIIGGLGLAAYSAANLFIDTFANQQNRNWASHSVHRRSTAVPAFDPNSTGQTPWFSFNWDACQLEEEHKPVSGFGASLAAFALTPQEVWQATRRILSMGSPSQVIISKGNLQARLDQWTGLRSSSQSPQVELSSDLKKSSSQHARPNLPNEYVAPRNEIEQVIANIWQDILGIEAVGVYDSFFELGGHSLLAIQTISRLRETFQVELPMRSLLFEAPTIAGIAAVIAENQPEQEELQEMAQLLEEVKSLSSEEIQQQLAIDD
jgi:acyl transferase domain-containing protein/acyl carrier protein